MFKEWPTSRTDDLFRVCVQVFDSTIDRKLDIYKLMKDPSFISLYRFLGNPDWSEHYIPRELDAVEDQAQLSIQTPAQIVSELTDGLSKLSALSDDDKGQIARTIFNKAMGLRSWYIGMYCSNILGTSVNHLIDSAQSGDKRAFVQLIELDSLFLTSNFAKQFICEAELSQDLDLKSQIANALNPFRKPRATKRQRQAFAVHLIKLFGPHRRSYSEWVDFLDTLGFDLKGSMALSKACQRADISKRGTN